MGSFGTMPITVCDPCIKRQSTCTVTCILLYMYCINTCIVHHFSSDSDHSSMFSRRMRLGQVRFVTLVALVLSTGVFASANTDEVTSFVAESAHWLFPREGATRDLHEATEISSVQEERRRSKAATAAAAGASGRATVPSSDTTTGSKTVTVTKYHNNGLLQRFKRWLNKLFSFGSSRSTRQLRQVG